MSQMQENPSSTETQCYIDTAATNVELINMSDITAYIDDGGNYDQAAFLNLAKVMQIKYIAQLESCEYIAFLVALDGMFTNIPQAAAAGVNLATQVGTGYQNWDTSIFLSIDFVKPEFDELISGSGEADWKVLGQGFQLFMSQILKISAGDTDIEVVPTSAA